ncbi:MAG: hypothetical protein CVV12_15295 [Gammaproteobacteria bacterium HGW-Gammaproteobacteria-2]|nr:MAG: hypothetical protein CVV12_15295 [Gammaproteobacteria bacterium HGW-Gammaproteobacteria-2]
MEINKKLLPPQRPSYTDEELERFSVNDLYRMKLTADETARLRAINEKRSQERERKAAEWRKAEQPLVDELRAAGFDVESAWELFNRKEPWNKKERVKPYPEALLILLNHLERPYPDRVREGIARALAVGRGTKDGLAVAISLIAQENDELLEEVIALAKDRLHGESRVLLLGALERSSDPRAKAALMELGTDPELKLEVQAIYRRLERRKR